MRFLLKSASGPKKISRISSGKERLNATAINSSSSCNLLPMTHNTITEESTTTTASFTKSWGQQCSNNCGCAIRFEINTNPNHYGHPIIDASYHAVQIVSTMGGGGGGLWSSTTRRNESLNSSISTNSKGSHQNNHVHRAPSSSSSTSKDWTKKYHLQPMLSIHPKNRPIFKECTCTTLHKLASEIVSHLPTMTLFQAQNQFEFTGIRSPPSFRYIVLRDILLQQHASSQNLNNSVSSTKKDKSNRIDPIMIEKYTPCYDLVEEAIIACLKGYMPKPRCMMNYSMYMGIPRGNKITSSSISADDENHSFLSNVSKRQQEEEEKWMSTTRRVDLDPLRYVYASKRRFASTQSSSFLGLNELDEGFLETMPAFHMMSNPNYNLNQSIMYEEEENHGSPITRKNGLDNGDYNNSMDWVSYVDEMNGEMYDRKVF